MSQTIRCCLCVKICWELKRLSTEINKLVVKYFDATILNVEQGDGVCLVCWRHIIDFHNFQTMIHHEQKKFTKNLDEVDVDLKSKDGCYSDTSLINNYELGLMNVNSSENNCSTPTEDYETDTFSTSNIAEIENELNPMNNLFSSSNNNPDDDYVDIFLVERCHDDQDQSNILPIAVAHCELGSSLNEDSTPISYNNASCHDDQDQSNILPIELVHCELGSSLEEDCTPILYTNDENTRKSSIRNHNLQTKETFCNTEKRKSNKQLVQFNAHHKPKLECGICNESCSNFDILCQHFETKHPNDDSQILCCKRQLNHDQSNILPIELVQCELGSSLDDDSTPIPYTNDENTRTRSLRNHNLQRKETFCNIATRKSIRQLDQFISRHKPNLECGICNEPCSNFDILRQHFKTKHPYDDSHILCCKRQLNSRSKIEEHILLHINPNAFCCEICGKFHKNRSNLNTHKNYRHPETHRKKIKRQIHI